MKKSDKIKIVLPTDGLYTNSMRLFVAGLASSLDYDTDKLDDLKNIISEVFVQAKEQKKENIELEIDILKENELSEIIIDTNIKKAKLSKSPYDMTPEELIKAYTEKIVLSNQIIKESSQKIEEIEKGNLKIIYSKGQ